MTRKLNGPASLSWEVTFRSLEVGEVELVLPEALVEKSRLRAGQKVHIWARDGKIFIEPRPRLSERLLAYTLASTEAILKLIFRRSP